MIGWISIHRKIQEHWLWQEKPFDKRSAWIDILMMVNHEDKKILLGNELIEVKRGSRITSIRKLCDKWGWSNTKVRNFLDLLQNDGMIEVKSDTKKTTLTVVNYNDYQIPNDSESDTKATRKRHENDTKATRKHTNNNDNNDNNDNNINITLQIENLRNRYLEEQLKVIDEYFDVLRWTRKNGKIADSVILKIYKEWEKFKPDTVIYGLKVYINNPKHHDKKENYCYGIMRNATAEEVASNKNKGGGKYGDRISFNVPKSEREIGTTEELNKQIKELGLI